MRNLSPTACRRFLHRGFGIQQNVFRNRLKACKLAGVEPRFEDLNGQDPAAFIVSANIERRHMTKGQRAMAAGHDLPGSG